MFKCLFIIFGVILPVIEKGITRVTVSLFSADFNISPEGFLFDPVGSNNFRVSIQKVSRFNLLIRSCQAECIGSFGTKISSPRDGRS